VAVVGLHTGQRCAGGTGGSADWSEVCWWQWWVCRLVRGVLVAVVGLHTDQRCAGGTGGSAHWSEAARSEARAALSSLQCRTMA